jgi:DinB superfamily
MEPWTEGARRKPWGLQRPARGTTPLPGYEQDDYVRDADFDSRNLADMAEEFATVRRATIQLFRTLNETEWLRHLKANENDVGVRAFAYIIAGHELHHMGVLRSRYSRVK